MGLRENANFAAIDEHVGAASNQMVHDEARVAPLGDRRLDLDRVAVSRGPQELRRHVYDRRADDAVALPKRAPWRHAAGDEELKRSRIHPAKEIRIEDDLRRIAITELDAKARDVTPRHDPAALIGLGATRFLIATKRSAAQRRSAPARRAASSSRR